MFKYVARLFSNGHQIGEKSSNDLQSLLMFLVTQLEKELSFCSGLIYDSRTQQVVAQHRNCSID
jgi:hypothetical protein